VPSDRNTSSKGAGELGVPVVDQEPYGPPLLLEGHGQVPALLGDPRRIRVACRSAEMHLPRPELDPHQHVQGLQPDGLHGEEVARQDPGRLVVEELTPRGTPPRGRTESGTAKHRGYRGCRDPDPELEKLSPYSYVAPPWVLPPQRRISSRTSGSRAGLPGGRCGLVHFWATSLRCQRRRVSGRTRNTSHASRRRVLLAAARNALSDAR